MGNDNYFLVLAERNKHIFIEKVPIIFFFEKMSGDVITSATKLLNGHLHLLSEIQNKTEMNLIVQLEVSYFQSFFFCRLSDNTFANANLKKSNCAVLNYFSKYWKYSANYLFLVRIYLIFKVKSQFYFLIFVNPTGNICTKQFFSYFLKYIKAEMNALIQQ